MVRQFLGGWGRFWFALAALGLIASWADAADAPRPNVVFIFADDLGFSDIGCYGGEIETPHLDRLAAEGLRFTQFYNTARCWPSRASILSGYYPQQVNRDPQGIRPAWAALLPQLLAPSGYRSYHSGKWHVDGPVLAAGFDRSYSLNDHDRNFYPKQHTLDDKPLPQPKPSDGYYSTTAITSHALDFLDDHAKSQADKPFFLYLCYTVPHFPLQAPAADVAKYRGRYKAGWDELRQARWERMTKLGLVNCELSARPPTIPAWKDLTSAEHEMWDTRMAIHAAMVDRMDQEIGRVVEKLRSQGVLDKTLVLFCSDNGASHEKLVRGDGHDATAPPGSAKTFECLEPAWSNFSNAPFRRSKMFVHEGGIATPLIVRWPAGIADKNAWRHTPSHLVDLVPTVLELAGAKSPETFGGKPRPPIAGRSLVPALAKDATIERDFLWWHHQGNRAFRVGDWKIVSAGPKGDWELYDLSHDRAEMHDLAEKQPERVKEMSALWAKQDALYFEHAGRPMRPMAGKKKE